MIRSESSRPLISSHSHPAHCSISTQLLYPYVQPGNEKESQKKLKKAEGIISTRNILRTLVPHNPSPTPAVSRMSLCWVRERGLGFAGSQCRGHGAEQRRGRDTNGGESARCMRRRDHVAQRGMRGRRAQRPQALEGGGTVGPDVEGTNIEAL